MAAANSASFLSPPGRRPGDPSAVGELLPLVQIMLGVLQRCQDALLQDESESLLVIEAMLQHLRGPHEATAPGQEARWELLEHDLDQLLLRALQSREEPLSQQALSACSQPVTTHRLTRSPPASWRQHDLHRLACYFHNLSTALRDSHPRAIEILRLRLSGLDAREIAARIDMPFRLVRQILLNVQARVEL